MTEPTELGRRVKAAREARGWTQQMLGRLARFPDGREGPTVADIERGKIREPRRARVETLAAVLAVPVEWLYGTGSASVPSGRKAKPEAAS